MKKKNSKPNPLIQTLVYRSNIYYSKIYQKEIEKTKQNFFWNERKNDLPDILLNSPFESVDLVF